MPEAFVALGEEAARGTAESTTVGYIPVKNYNVAKPDYMAKKREEFRGEETALGPTTEERWGEKWDGLPLEIPFHTESGVAKGLIGSILKHFFGHVASSQNGATGQYRHMFSAVADPFDENALGAKALTLNMNHMLGLALKNHPHTGGRVKKLSFKQEPANPLMMTAEFCGQKRDAAGDPLASPTFPAANIRCDYNALTVRQGATVSRTGSAPDYTAITSNGTVVKPDSLSLELDFGLEDRQVLDGATSPGETSVKQLTGKLSMTFDYRDPSSGFSSVDELAAWIAAVSSTNFLLTWDTGTQAGTGDNHAFIVDLPACNRLGGNPEFSLIGRSRITLEWDFHYSPTTEYSVGMLLKNTASAV
ncbi:MAG: hypothetical protein HS130_00890 [Deltaproteobacteria bacterium]|nr:hypothetical protein [Deltaproteobacteria bacterium]MCL4873857.1 hypothetical protein [bacterium]